MEEEGNVLGYFFGDLLGEVKIKKILEQGWGAYKGWGRIGVGRFRILGEPRFRIWGGGGKGGGGPNSQQAHDVVTTSM